MLGRSKGTRWLASSSHRRDSELLVCCIAARLSSVRISRWAQQSSGVMGFGSPRSKAAAVAMFWLARVKCGRASLSLMILRFTSWATVHARPPSPWRSISHSSSAHSRSSWCRASSSSWCRALSCFTHRRGGAPTSTSTSLSRSSIGVAPPSWMLLMYPSGVPAMKHFGEG